MIVIEPNSTSLNSRSMGVTNVSKRELPSSAQRALELLRRGPLTTNEMADKGVKFVAQQVKLLRDRGYFIETSFIGHKALYALKQGRPMVNYGA